MASLNLLSMPFSQLTIRMEEGTHDEYSTITKMTAASISHFPFLEFIYFLCPLST